MSRSRIFNYNICTVLAVVWGTSIVLLAQDILQSGPPQSTSFMSVPTDQILTEQATTNNSAGIYPQTNPGVAGSGITTGMVQPAMTTSVLSSSVNPSLGNQTSIPTSQGTPTTGANSINRADPFLPTTTLEPEKPLYFEEAWSWQYLPDSLLYQSYLAGGREPRFASQWVFEKEAGWLWDVTLGGRVGILRYGTVNSHWPEGWQIDIEGAAFPRLNMEHERDLDAVDFRFGIPLTVRRGPWQGKFGYYHLSSHLGDEFMVRNHTLDRINYVRDSMIVGAGFFLNRNIRLYGETAWAFYTDGGAEPWEFQFGVEYSPAEPTYEWAVPFFAINSHLRQENDFGGNFTVQSGLQWRGHSGHLIRIGMHYFNGMSDMYQFFRRHEEQIGLGLWYDF